MEKEPINVVWLKRDVRLMDHEPLARAMECSNSIVLLYLYEPDQLSEPSVHGSHISIVNEGLIDLDCQLCGPPPSERHELQFLTVCYAGTLETLEEIHHSHGIAGLFAHEETGHLKSYERDRQVRKWCKTRDISFLEIAQSGVTRRLSNRDEFSKHLKAFLNKIVFEIPDIPSLRCKLLQLSQLPGFCTQPLMEELHEIPETHRVDRLRRQRGGEREGLSTLTSFLMHRGSGYSAGISSPNTCWKSGSRLSIFLSWGHLSLRYVHQETKKRQEELRNSGEKSPWLKSLAAFSSRLHWRSHFMQKLESEPMLEVRDLHPAYALLCHEPGDWNEAYYQAWATGETGFPMVDACMRCLLHTGWLNFRMRAMLVSFACYNLWLDWTRLTGHLARCFLDYEPGIHYPQIQMQAGTTGINAIRAYNVVKQGQDQDPEGTFVKQYVKELAAVPVRYIHLKNKKIVESTSAILWLVTFQCIPSALLITRQHRGKRRLRSLLFANKKVPKQRPRRCTTNMEVDPIGESALSLATGMTNNPRFPIYGNRRALLLERKLSN